MTTTTGDEAIDAAFGDASDPVSKASSSTGDEAIDSAFSADTAPKSGNEVIKDLLHAKVSKGIASIGGGLLATKDLLTGKSIAEADEGYKKFVRDNAYQPTDPKTQALLGINQQVESSPANPLTWPGRALDVAGKGINAATGSTVAGPVTEGLAEAALPFVGMRSGASLAKNFDTQAALNAAVSGSKQSMGAAAVAPDLASMSPATQAGFKAMAQRTGGAVNPEAATNISDADANGIQLMRGQATRDPEQYSKEYNSTHPDIVARRSKQAQQLVDRLDEIRQQDAPGMVHNDKIQNGQAVVDDLKAHDEPVQADIRAKYKALTDANGGAVPIDPGALLGNVDRALKKNYLTDSVPPAAGELLRSLRAGEPLDFEGFEAARSRLAEAQREGGSAGQAARIIRNELEQLPLSPGASQLKTLADQARGAAKARFDALERDPAYQAAVDDVSSGVKRGAPSSLADRFLDKYVLDAPKANIDGVMSKLSSEGQEAVRAHTLSAIRDRTVTGNGADVKPNGFNTTMQKYGPKLDSLIPSATRESLESYGRTLNNVKTPPPAHRANYSHSGIVAGEAMESLAAHAINAKTLGLGVPVLRSIPGVKNIPGIRSAQDAFAKHALENGAGLDDLATKP